MLLELSSQYKLNDPNGHLNKVTTETDLKVNEIHCLRDISNYNQVTCEHKHRAKMQSYSFSPLEKTSLTISILVLLIVNPIAPSNVFKPLILDL